MASVTHADKVKIGYQAAISLISYEGQIIWRAFSAMLAANAVLIAIAGTLPKLVPNLSIGSPILSALGLLICIIWLCVLRRQFSYYRYWFSWARHFEKTYLLPEVKITLLGKTYGEGGSVEDNDNIPLQRFGWIARTFRVEWLMAIVICAVGTIYGMILAYYWIGAR